MLETSTQTINQMVKQKKETAFQEKKAQDQTDMKNIENLKEFLIHRMILEEENKKKEEEVMQNLTT